MPAAVLALGIDPVMYASRKKSQEKLAAQISAEKQEEYIAHLEFLAKVRTPLTKIEYRQNKDGSREYVVHFSPPISSFHSIRETKTLMFKAAGRHGVFHFGDDRAGVHGFAPSLRCLFAFRVRVVEA